MPNSETNSVVSALETLANYGFGFSPDKIVVFLSNRGSLTNAQKKYTPDISNALQKLYDSGLTPATLAQTYRGLLEQRNNRD